MLYKKRKLHDLWRQRSPVLSWAGASSFAWSKGVATQKDTAPESRRGVQVRILTLTLRSPASASGARSCLTEEKTSGAAAAAAGGRKQMRKHPPEEGRECR